MSSSPFQPRSAFARALNRILSDGRFTRDELAEIGGVSPRLVGYLLTGEKPFPLPAAEKIARYLSENGETRASVGFASPRHALVERLSGTADGCVRREIVDIVRSMADIDCAHGERDGASMRSACAQLREALADLESECDALDA